MCEKTRNNFAITTNAGRKKGEKFSNCRVYFIVRVTLIPPRHWNGHPLCAEHSRVLGDGYVTTRKVLRVAEGCRRVVRGRLWFRRSWEGKRGHPLMFLASPVSLLSYVYISLAVLNRPRSFSGLETRRFRYGNIRVERKNSLRVSN